MWQWVEDLISRIPTSVRVKLPEIMMGVGTAAVVGGTALIAHESTKLDDIVAAYKAEKAAAETDGEARKATAKLCGKVVVNYLPGVATEAAGLGLMWNGFGSRTAAYASVGAAFAGLKTTYDGLERSIREQYGDDAADKLFYGAKEVEIPAESSEGENGDESAVTTETALVFPEKAADMPSPYARYFAKGDAENASDSFTYNENFLARIVQDIFGDKYLRANRMVELNEVYAMLGIKPSASCAGIGWLYDLSDPNRHNYIDLRVRTVYRVKYDDFGTPIGTQKVHIIDPNVDGPIYRDAVRKGLMTQ